MAWKPFFLRSPALFLLGSLIIIIAFGPVSHGNAVLMTVQYLLFCLIPVTSVLVISDRRREMIVALALAIPTVITVFVSALTGRGTLGGSAGAVILAYYVFATVLTLRHLIRRRRVDTETLATAISAYLLVGVTFAIVYSGIAALYPDAFTAPFDDPLARFDQALYYSFVTLTTLGYGDISPVAPSVRTLAIIEAAIGVLYMAVVIARLVGLAQVDDSHEGSRG